MNVFEKIIAKEIPASIEYEDEHTLVFHDIDPQAPIHLLAIPKKVMQDFEAVDGQTLEHLMVAIKAVTEKMGLNKSGYRLITNCGEDSGQEVPHLHFHILGGTKLNHKIHADRSKEVI